MLKFEEDALLIEFDHQHVFTEEEVQWIRCGMQQRLSQKAGKEIPLEEIHVTPDVGETHRVTTGFLVKVGKPLYSGLQVIHAETPDVLPRLMADLTSYMEKQRLDENQNRLLGYTIGELEKIIKPKNKEKQL